MSTVAAIALVAALPVVAAGAAEWTFEARLDGTPIGRHRFAVTPHAGGRDVVSEADFAVRLLGLTVYRYRHRAHETWRGDCLETLASRTDDDGAASRVDAVRAAGGLQVSTDTGTRVLAGCVMSFAYWNPAIRVQPRLLNAQTGALDAVQIRRLDDATLPVGGVPVAATRWRISGPAAPIDVWYSARGDWIGLDAPVAGGRTLTYRLP